MAAFERPILNFLSSSPLKSLGRYPAEEMVTSYSANTTEVKPALLKPMIEKAMNRCLFKVETEFGGEKSIGKRKSQRPLSPKASLHLVLKLNQSVPSLRTRDRQRLCQSEINHWSKHFDIQVHARSVNSTHLHLLIQGRELPKLRNFIRVLTGQLAQKLGDGLQKFWETLPYSRIVRKGKDFFRVLKYIERNTLEAAGLISYRRGDTPIKTQEMRGLDWRHQTHKQHGLRRQATGRLNLLTMSETAH